MKESVTGEAGTTPAWIPLAPADTVNVPNGPDCEVFRIGDNSLI